MTQKEKTASVLKNNLISFMIGIAFIIVGALVHYLSFTSEDVNNLFAVIMVRYLAPLAFVVVGIIFTAYTFFGKHKTEILRVTKVQLENDIYWVFLEVPTIGARSVINYLKYYIYKTTNDTFRVGDIYNLKVYKYGVMREMLNGSIYLRKFSDQDFYKLDESQVAPELLREKELSLLSKAVVKVEDATGSSHNK